MTPPRLDRILNGIQAGMLGGLALCGVMCVLLALDLRPWWTFSNLLAAAWYGPRALPAGPGWITVTGAALQLAITGIAGALFGLLFGQLTGAARVALLGIFWGILLFFVSERLYGATAPLVAVHYPRGAALAAHIVYGVFLTGVRRRDPTKVHAVTPLRPAAVPETPAADLNADSEPELPSGALPH